MKFFNNAGPVRKEDNYYIDPLTRVDWEEIQGLIEQKRYFLLHAPRQTGKTTLLLTIMETLNKEDRYAVCYANIEGAQAARGNVERGVDAICSAIANAIALHLKDDSLKKWYLSIEGRHISFENKITTMLELWAKNSPKPVILLLDEVDALVGDTLISLLRQIRAGYAQRPEAFPHSLILCGVRDIKDYRIHTADKEIITGGSAFNIKAESLRMDNFTYNECQRLWFQHTEETGQHFDETIFPELWEDTMGQPWLVNALGYELTWRDKELRKNKNLPITLEKYKEARERLIQNRATHLDQLVDKLKEDRVKRVIEPLLKGEEAQFEFNPHDVSYVQDLGLIYQYPNKKIEIANRIYREVIPRELSYGSQIAILQENAWYIKPDNTLDMPKLLRAFQEFFRRNADSWLERFDYKEAGPQLLMQAFLQRIINGGGRIYREYALGRKRTDLFIEWPTTEKGFYGSVQKIVIELKILRDALDTTISTGLIQTREYASIVGADELYLVIFNRDQQTPWDEKIWERNVDGVMVMGC